MNFYHQVEEENQTQTEQSDKNSQRDSEKTLEKMKK